MIRYAVIYLLMLGTVSGFGRVLREGDPADVEMAAEQLAQIDRVVQEAIQNEETPGAVILVARKGVVVYRKAFGHRALQPNPEPMTLDTVFDMASLTKVMATATAVMILVEEGRLSLTDPVVKYLPDFSRHEKESISVLQLLTHYSGLRPDVDLDEAWSGYQTAIELAFDEELVAPPGTKFIYSDINYFVLAEIVQQISGIPFFDFVRDRIYRPLGMTDTAYRPPAESSERIAPTERRDGGMLRGSVHDPTTFRMGGYAGHAGLFSTADDTAVFGQMILNLGVYGEARILSPLGVLTMTTPQSPAGQRAWRGIGFDIRTGFSSVRGDLFPPGSFGHTGFTGTSLWIDPYTETLVVLLTSRLHPEGKGNVVPLRKRIASVVAAAIREIPWELRERYYR